MDNTRFKTGLTPHNKLPIPDKEALVYLYCDWRLTTQQIGEHYQVSNGTVSKWLKHHSISLRSAGTGLSQRGIEPPTNAELVDMIHVQNLSYREVAERYGVDQSAVQHWLDQRGINRPQSWYDRHNNKECIAELQDLYQLGLSLSEIGQSYGVTKGRIAKLFRDNNIELRQDGWQGKRFQTTSGELVRSTYELKVANWLHDHRIDFIYEPSVPFSNKWRADFFANGWYIEIWGVTNSPDYKTRQKAKTEAYKKHGSPLIELPVHSFDTHRNSMWERHLLRCLNSPQ